MNFRHRAALFSSLIFHLLVFAACGTEVVPTSQSVEDFPIYPDATMTLTAPAEIVSTVADLEKRLARLCLGKWSYYLTKTDPNDVMQWYRNQMQRTGWNDAVAEEQFSQLEQLSNWGVWYSQDISEKDVVVLMARSVVSSTIAISPTLNAGDELREDTYTCVVIRQCSLRESQ